MIIKVMNLIYKTIQIHSTHKLIAIIVKANQITKQTIQINAQIIIIMIYSTKINLLIKQNKHLKYAQYKRFQQAIAYNSQTSNEMEKPERL